MNHYMAFVSGGQPTFGWASEVGWTGVDLFFVLSGYLISNQLFAGLARGEVLAPHAFYARRALRTWPAFWVVLTLYFLFPAFMGGQPLPPLWRFLTFTQNIGLHAGTGFSHAWSLCIEEQFYLILPLVVIAGMQGFVRRRHGWLLIVMLITLGVACRTILWVDHGTYHTGYYPYIYYSTLCRFDEFLPGVAVAALKNFHRPFWERMMRRGQRLLLLGALTTATLYYIFYHYGYTFFLTSAGYSLMAMSFAVLVASALSPDSWLHRIRIPGAYHIAVWSYSVYLSHKAVMMILRRELEPLALPSAVLVCTVAVASIWVGALLYRLVEAPMMALRDRWFPSTFASPEDTMAHGADPGYRLS